MVRIIDKLTKKEAHIEKLSSDYFVAWVDEDDVSDDMKEFAGIKSVRFGRISELKKAKSVQDEAVDNA